MNKYFFYIMLLVFSACSLNNKKQEVAREDSDLLAKVGEYKLYASDLPKYIFKNRTQKDSLEILKNYVDKWIKESVYEKKAIDIISNLDEINTEVNNYKRELIISSYDKEILDNLDENLTIEELKDYYENNKEFFVLDEDYFEINYIIIPKNTSNIAKIKKSISKGEENHWVQNYCNENPTKCFIDKSTIKNSTYLKQNLGIVTQKISSKYKYHYIDSDNVMIYKIVKVYKKGDIAPFEIVKKEVTRLALHDKKQKHLQEIKEKTYQKAKDDEIFEKYIN